MSSTKKCDGCAACGKEGATDACRLCGDSTVAYCGAECATNDWSKHHEECNIALVSSQNALVAQIYMFQDVLDNKYFAPEDLKRVSQQYMVQHISPKGMIAFCVVPSVTQKQQIGDSLGEAKAIAAQRYTLWVNGEQATELANIKTDTIQLRSPGSAGKMAAQRIAEPSKTLWTPLKAPIHVMLGHSIDVEVRDEKGVTLDKSTVDFTHNIDQKTDFMSTLSRRARAPISYQLQEKSLGAYSHVLPMVATDGNKCVRMIFDVSDIHSAKLLDVEYRLPVGATAPTGNWQEHHFKCDARDIDQVSGLCAAVENSITTMRETDDDNVNLATLEKDYETIHAYLDRLHDDVNTQPDAFVNAAIQRCSQHQFVGGPAKWFRRQKGQMKEAKVINKAREKEDIPALIEIMKFHTETAIAEIDAHKEATNHIVLAKMAERALTELTSYVRYTIDQAKEIASLSAKLKPYATTMSQAARRAGKNAIKRDIAKEQRDYAKQQRERARSERQKMYGTTDPDEGDYPSLPARDDARLRDETDVPPPSADSELKAKIQNPLRFDRTRTAYMPK